MHKTILNPIIPYVGCIGDSGTFTPQNLIKIQGTIPENAYRFEISLLCGPNTVSDDIGLHISVKPLKGLIYFNSFRDGTWGEEISKSIEPIQPEEKFEIIVLCQENQYTITINGEDYYNYPQIIHYGLVSHLGITGDLSITQICYESASESESADIFDGDETLASSRNELLPSENGMDGTKIEHAGVTLENDEVIPNSVSFKRGCKWKEVSCVFVIIFVIFAVTGGLIYWYCSDDGTNVAQIKKGFRGVYGWYKNDSTEKP